INVRVGCVISDEDVINGNLRKLVRSNIPTSYKIHMKIKEATGKYKQKFTISLNTVKRLWLPFFKPGTEKKFYISMDIPEDKNIVNITIIDWDNNKKKD